MSQQAMLLEKEWTLEEWLSLPEGPPYYELEGGKLVLMPLPRREHQQMTGLLFARLHDHCRQREAGTVVMEVDVALPNGRGYIPDIAFIAREREGQLHIRSWQCLDMIGRLSPVLRQSRWRFIRSMAI